MYKEFADQKLGAIFRLSDNFQRDYPAFAARKDLIHILWNRNEEKVQFEIDAIPVNLEPNQLITITYLQIAKFSQKFLPVTAFSFNREFYCIKDHDHEVSCNGIIFFGTQDLPLIKLEGDEKHSFELLFQVFQEEFGTRDNIQGEMLQMLLKRLIIKLTRLAKIQNITQKLENSQIETIRKFNVLVDLNYKTKRQVKDYADLLFKSPKTLSNLFALYNQKSPLQIIHERIILEARRLLSYSDKTITEIAYELGFDEVTPFNKNVQKSNENCPRRI